MTEQSGESNVEAARRQAPEPSTDAGQPVGRRAWLVRWLVPVAACGVAVGLHAYFQVPKGRYQPRPDPEQIRRRRAKQRARRRRRQMNENTKKAAIASPPSR